MSKDILEHHGIKGMRWGVRKDGKPQGYQYTNKGTVLKKGTKVTRIALSSEDPTYGGKKHVSLTAKDQKAWENSIGKSYDKRGWDTYNVKYEATKDLDIASIAETGSIFSEKFLQDPSKRDQAIKDIQESYKTMYEHGFDIPDDYYKYPDLMASVQIAYQTETGKQFCDEMLKLGYEGVVDSHGMNTAEYPVIILDPDNNLKKVEVKKR